jgi:hypothetical protein
MFFALALYVVVPFTHWIHLSQGLQQPYITLPVGGGVGLIIVLPSRWSCGCGSLTWWPSSALGSTSPAGRR